MDVLLFAVMAASNIVCFVIGAMIGQRAAKGKEIKLPSVNPLEAFREQQSKKEAEMEQDRFNTIMRNIENYDGTGRGQEDVTRK